LALLRKQPTFFHRKSHSELDRMLSGPMPTQPRFDPYGMPSTPAYGAGVPQGYYNAGAGNRMNGYQQGGQGGYSQGPAHGATDPFSSPRHNVSSQKVNLLPNQIPPVGHKTSGFDNGQRYHERVINEGSHIVHEKVIEVPKKVVQERVVEIPEVQYKYVNVEVPEVIRQEKIVQKVVDRVEQRLIPVPKVVQVDKVIEVPEVEYIDVPVERIIEVPEYREEIVVRHVEVPQYVEVPYPEYRQVPVPQEVERHLPVPVEVTATYEYRMPCIRPVYKDVQVPIYVPRYIEVPVPAHKIDPELLRSLDDRMNQLSRNPATTREDLVRLAEQARQTLP